MALGARNKFGEPMFEPKVFQMEIYCIKESTFDIVGTFYDFPQWFGARGIAFPLPPLVTPLIAPLAHKVWRILSQLKQNK